MQNLIYDQAPYDILYYDANLAAYRTDRFAGWENQPASNGTPLFTYSTLNYTKLTDAAAVPPRPRRPPPTPRQRRASGATPAASEAPATPAPARDGRDRRDTAARARRRWLVVIVAAVLIGVGSSGLADLVAALASLDDDE